MLKRMGRIEVGMNSNLMRVGVSTFFLMIFAAVSLHYFGEVVGDGSGYRTGDWLINYSAGFMRRGLLGEVFLAASAATSIDAALLAYGLQIFLLLLVVLLTIRVFWRSPRTVADLAVLLSPAFLLFQFYDLHGSLRKELLVFVAFLILVNEALKSKSNNLVLHVLPLLLFVVTIFSHEIAIFTMPFFVIMLGILCFEGRLERWQALALIVAYGILSLLGVFISIAYPGNAESARIICESIKPAVKNADILCRDGAISWLSDGAGQGVRQVVYAVTNSPYIAVYGGATLFASAPFLLFSYPRRILSAVIVVLPAIAMLPLFVVALDWGRWIHIYFFLLSIVFFYARSKGYVVEKWRLPFVLAVLYGASWSFEHSWAERMGFGVFRQVFNALKYFGVNY